MGLTTSYSVLLDIVLITRSELIQSQARNLAVDLLARSICLDASCGEWVQDVHYESSCWVDGLTSTVREEFLTTLRVSSPAHNILTLSKAWKDAALPVSALPMNVSSLLVHSLSSLSSLSYDFELLSCQVAARCVVHHRMPLSAAALVGCSNRTRASGKSEDGSPFQTLSAYCSSTLSSQEPKFRRLQLCSAMLKANFHNRSAEDLLGSCGDLVRRFRPKESALEHGIESMKQSMHFFLISESKAERRRYLKLFRRCVPYVVKVSYLNVSSRISFATDGY